MILNSFQEHVGLIIAQACIEGLATPVAWRAGVSLAIIKVRRLPLEKRAIITSMVFSFMAGSLAAVFAFATRSEVVMLDGIYFYVSYGEKK